MTNTVTLPRAVVEQALRTAYSLGQTYWRLADSDSFSNHKKADVTEANFKALIADTLAAPQPEPVAWMPIETAPKDGTKVLLAKYDWSSDTGDAAFGSADWKQRVFDETRRKYSSWWCCEGRWSERWGNWNDGIEPCGLAGPTHWMPLPAPPQEPTP